MYLETLTIDVLKNANNIPNFENPFLTVNNREIRKRIYAFMDHYLRDFPKKSWNSVTYYSGQDISGIFEH